MSQSKPGFFQSIASSASNAWSKVKANFQTDNKNQPVQGQDQQAPMDQTPSLLGRARNIAAANYDKLVSYIPQNKVTKTLRETIHPAIYNTFSKQISNVMPALPKSLSNLASSVSNNYGKLVTSIVSRTPMAAETQAVATSFAKSSAPFIAFIAAGRAVATIYNNWGTKKSLFDRTKDVAFAAGEAVAEGVAGTVGASIAVTGAVALGATGAAITAATFGGALVGGAVAYGAVKGGTYAVNSVATAISNKGKAIYGKFTEACAKRIDSALTFNK